MAEIVYQYIGEKKERGFESYCRWLEESEHEVFCRHLELCEQKPVSVAVWKEIWQEEIEYSGLFIDDKMVARACIERYSEDYWEVADVRVVKAFRNRGYAYEICLFVMNKIIERGKIPTIRTEETNEAMKQVIRKLGFVEICVGK